MAELLSVQDAMVLLYPRTHGPECADKYRAIAEWWRLNAKITKIPSRCLRYAAAQDVIADRMLDA